MRRNSPFAVSSLIALVPLLLAMLLPSAGSAAGQGGPNEVAGQGVLSDPRFFPLAVWCQDPAKAEDYEALGINTYVMLWQGPTEDDLAKLAKAGMKTICEQNAVGLRHLDDPTIIGWMHGDEPDNILPRTEGGAATVIPPDKIIADYQAIKQKDPSRPVLLNLAQGVALDTWRVRGCALSDYRKYLEGCDIASFDIYPVVQVGLRDGENWFWLVARGVDRLRHWGDDRKLVWNCVECTHVDRPDKKITPLQMKGEVWMSIIHGSKGIIYFVHQFQPSFIEAGLLADQEMTAQVKAVNQQILALAPVLNSPTLEDAAGAASSSPNVPVDIMVKREGNALYIFAVAMRIEATHATFRVEEMRGREAPKDGMAEVIGEGRSLPVRNGDFGDDFAPYDVHIYRVSLSG